MVLTEQLDPKIVEKIKEMFALHYSPAQIKRRIVKLGIKIEIEQIKDVTADKPSTDFTKLFDSFPLERQLFFARRYLGRNYKSHQKLTAKGLNGSELTWWAFPKRHSDSKKTLRKNFPKEHFYEMVNYFSGDNESGLRLMTELLLSFPGASSEFVEETKKLLAMLPKPPRKVKKEVIKVEVEDSDEEKATIPNTLKKVAQKAENVGVVDGIGEDDDLPPLKFQKTALQGIATKSPKKTGNEKLNKAGEGVNADADDENEDEALSPPNKVQKIASTAAVVSERDGGKKNAAPAISSSIAIAVVKGRENGNSSSGTNNYVPVSTASKSGAVAKSTNIGSGKSNYAPVPTVSCGVGREKESVNIGSGKNNYASVATVSSSAAGMREIGNSSSSKINTVPVSAVSSLAAVVKERERGNSGSSDVKIEADPVSALASLASAAAIVQRSSFVNSTTGNSFQSNASQSKNQLINQSLQSTISEAKHHQKHNESPHLSGSGSGLGSGLNIMNSKDEALLSGDKRKRES